MIQFNNYHIILILSCLALSANFYYLIFCKDGKPNKFSNFLILIVIANLILNPFYIKDSKDISIFPIMIEAYLDIAFIVIVSVVGFLIAKLIFKKYDKNN